MTNLSEEERQMIAKLISAGILGLGAGAVTAIPGAIGGAVSSRGSGLFPGAFRGFGLGVGGTVGGVAGDLIADKLFQGDDKARAIGTVLGGLTGAGLGYRAGAHLTKTRKEQLHDEILKYYEKLNASEQPSKMPQPNLTNMDIY